MVNVDFINFTSPIHRLKPNNFKQSYSFISLYQVEAALKYFLLSIVFSYSLLIGIAICYAKTGQTDISQSFSLFIELDIVDYKCLGFMFIILGIIGKFGLFPSNLGMLGIVDNISLFSTIILLVLNKYVYLIILGLNILPPINC